MVVRFREKYNTMRQILSSLTRSTEKDFLLEVYEWRLKTYIDSVDETQDDFDTL